jgi:hypothetical protein
MLNEMAILPSKGGSSEDNGSASQGM